MTLPSQFSLEEENFYKDIQNLVKKPSQNEKDLSLFLERYRDHLARADLDDETMTINFTKAGLIIEASAKVYGTKVDRLWINLEHVLESLKNKWQGQGKKKSDGDEYVGEDLDVDGSCYDMQDGNKRKLPNGSRRRKKLGDALFSSDDFLEIDNLTGLSGKNMNETSCNIENKLKLCEKIPNMFIKNKTKKKKISICLNKCLEDKDIIRLRDWIISTECLLIKEIYTSDKTIFFSNYLEGNEMKKTYGDSEASENNEDHFFGNSEERSMQQHNIEVPSSFTDEKNNNVEHGLELEENLGEQLSDEPILSQEKSSLIDQLNVSKKSDMAKFPNVMNRLSEDCLVDVDEVFWNPSQFQDIIPKKKMREGKINKLPCKLCTDKKVHKNKNKRCVDGKKIDCIDSFFSPHVQPTISEPHFGILPDDELYNAFKVEMKLIQQLGKVDMYKNINDAYHPHETSEELKNFLGFDGFETYLMKKKPDSQDDEISEGNALPEILEEENENYADDNVLNGEFELPIPVTETSLKSNLEENIQDSKLKEANSESEYQKLVIEELRDHYAAKTSFAKNKELGIKISKWHEMIAEKIKLSQRRGALNVKFLAEKIMRSFPPTNGEKSTITFHDLVKKQCRRDIPRYFFACLQLANEGNINIDKLNSEHLSTDCMVLTRLRTTRTNYELDESSTKTPSKQLNSSKNSFVQSKRKRNSISNSPSVLETMNFSKNKKLKYRIPTFCKRRNSFNLQQNAKRRRSSVSSADSVVVSE